MQTTTEHDALTSYMELTVLMLGNVKCESNHADPQNQVCSGAVVARCVSVCGQRTANVCAADYEYGQSLIRSGRFRCAYCMSPCWACWSYVLI